MSEPREDMDQIEAANDYVEALLAGRQPTKPAAAIKGQAAEALLSATQLASVGQREVAPSADFVQRLRLRLTGKPRRSPFDWRVSRRAVLGGMGGAVATVAVALFGQQALERLSGRSTIPAGWVPIARAADVPPGTVKRFIAQDVEGHVMNINGNIWALSAMCTHLACVVDWQAQDKLFLCPCHGAEFGMNGQQLGDQSYGVSLPPLARIPVMQADGRLYVVLNRHP